MYEKALRIRYERESGLWRPILWHLALRRHADAMIELADWISDGDSLRRFGKPADPFSAAGLYRRAWKSGNERAAANIAASNFNRNNLADYRRWLRHAADAGSRESAAELRAFETRLPHGAARKIRRLRPMQMRDRQA
ncbi:hypothetical protein [Sphingomonas sp. NFR04]|uniref:hypothetical protein n=1 Tax=Sphingomonas sp. NFR04 TaxID=1566283 RepID=UPI001586F923|nr:hypothetical protein [Sphingomonas sp. NFR04]